MRKILLFVGFALLSFVCYAQTTRTGKEAKDMWDKIQKASGAEYIHGVGYGATEKEALDEAKSIINGLISTQIRSDFEYKLEQKSNGEDIQAEEQVKSVIKSYSNNTLSNLNMLVLSEAPKSKVAVYILKEDLKKQYEARKQRALKCLGDAKEAKEKGNLDEVFDKLYTAEMLIGACPGKVEVQIISQTKNASDFIADEKSEVANGITIEELDMYAEGENDIISVMFKYKDKPVSKLSYAYEVNGVTSDVYVTNDGVGEIIVPKNFKKRLTAGQNFCVKVGYFSGDINKIDILDRDVRQIVSPCKVVSYKENKNLVAKAAPQETAEVQTSISTDSEGRFPVVALTEEEAAPFFDTMKQMEVIIRNKNYSAAAKLCTAEGFDMFNKLINYGTARLLTVPALKFLRCGDDITCRSYPMAFSFKSSSRKFTENVVFHLNSEGKITEVAFALETKAVDDIMNNKSDQYYDNDVKQIIVNFLERYKTAFALKRIDYIESIFSEDALIIVGSVLKKAENYTDMAKFKGDFEKKVRYTRQKKGEYMNNLARCFSSNEYVNVRFTGVEAASGKPFKGVKNRFYSIQLKQDYFSQTYGDTGYLFLDLDLKDRLNPIINVRVWQPDKNGPFVNNGVCSFNDFTWEE